MAELRLDPTTRRWVVTGKRPIMPDVIDTGNLCPFCPGNEQMTPKAIAQFLGSDGKWTVRVFHDRAPAFRVEGNLDRRGEGLFDRMNPLGAHEIVVETPQHGCTLAQLEPPQIEKILEVCRDRILDLKHDIRFRYVSLFKDQAAPGPTLQGHSHAKILASPVLPVLIENEFRWCRFHFQKKERCLYCDILQQESQQDKRVVERNAEYLALCPYASRSPYELWILPPRHCSSFEKDMGDPVYRRSLASFLKSNLRRIEKLSPILHLVVHTEPNLASHKQTEDWWSTIPDDFHWHIEIHPDIEGERRFLGSEGFYFNPIPAEEATLILRAFDQIPDSDSSAP
jgi:UDPglucose--hexose-1-phosphate uridylyltransferase